ncbi:MAG: helix-turn-helix transcriptional regulator [Bacteroidales bacterium]
MQKKEVALQIPYTGKEAENAALFEILNNRVLADKLYLNPTIERGDLCKVIGVEKNRFAQIIRQNTGTHLIGYINNLRLDYAVQLMKEHPQFLISKVSMHSGLTNIRTFYRLFHNRFGMTPLEYRKSLQSKNLF